jgi:glycosyltransferase involved in cell wall biosynthesis
MKVLFLCYELPPIGGGGGRAAWQVATRLAARGHGVAILTSRFGDLAAEETRAGVRIVRLAVRRKRADECAPLELLSVMLKSMPAALREVDRDRPDVICAFFGVPGGPGAWWAKRRRGVPYVLALRGSDVPRPELSKHQFLHHFTKPVLRRVYRAAAGIVSVSDGLRQAALGVEPGVEIEVIPNGIDTEWFAPGAVKPERPDRVELLFVGRLRDFKGVQHIIRAMPEIARRLAKPVRLTVAGDGPYRPELERLAAEQLRAPSEARFAGWMEREPLRAAYEAAHLFVLPSLVEGHPNVVLEGMAMGLPCVATDAPGIREAVAHGVDGLLTPPESPQAIAEAVVALMSDGAKRREMSRAARAKAESMSWDRIAQRYEAALARACGRGPAA